MGPSGVGWNWRYRVTSLDGLVQAQSLDAFSQSDVGLANMTVDGLFETVRQRLSAGGDLRVTFDPDLGYPAEITYANTSVSDGDSTETVTSFASEADAATVAHLRDVLRSARLAWKRWEPTAYEYVWRRFEAATGPTSGTAWRAVRAGGRSSTEADPVSDGALPADSASVASTFDAVGCARCRCLGLT